MSIQHYNRFLKMYGFVHQPNTFAFVRKITVSGVPLPCLKFLWTLMLWKTEIEKHRDNNVLVYTVKMMIGGTRVKNDFILMRLTRLLKSFAFQLGFVLPKKYFYRYLDQLAQRQTPTFAYILLMCFPVTVGMPRMRYKDDPVLFENALKDPNISDDYVLKIRQWIDGSTQSVGIGSK